VITTLFVISFLAIAGYCLLLAWPMLTRSQVIKRQPRPTTTHVVRSLYDMGADKPTERPRLLKR